MNIDGTYPYEEVLTEFYRAEIIGEAIMSALIEAASDPVERLKLAHLLQLETETKAWLRPHMIRAGLSVAEPAEFRELAKQLVADLATLEWPAKMRAFTAFVSDLVEQYGAYVEAARRRDDAAQAAVCEFMVVHELVQGEFAQLELEGAELSVSLEPLMRESLYPLPLSV